MLLENQKIGATAIAKNVGDFLRNEKASRLGLITKNQIQLALPISILDLGHPDARIAFFSESFRSNIRSKLHYYAASGNFLNEILCAAVSKFIPGARVFIEKKDIFVGAVDYMSPSQISDWERVSNRSSVIKNENDRHQIMINEIMAIAGRKTLSHEIFKALDAGIIVINDKDRGNQMQFARLLPATKKVVEAIRRNDDRIDEEHKSIFGLFLGNPNDRFCSLTGDQLTPTELAAYIKLPSAINVFRKIFYTNSTDSSINPDYIEAFMGWSTHGRVPFSEFSSINLHDYIEYFKRNSA